jgi:hypothetical protein
MREYDIGGGWRLKLSIDLADIIEIAILLFLFWFAYNYDIKAVNECNLKIRQCYEYFGVNYTNFTEKNVNLTELLSNLNMTK